MEPRTVDYGNYEQTMQEALRGLARANILDSNGQLVEISMNPELYPSQKAYYLGNENLIRDPMMITEYATLAEKRFPAIQERVDNWGGENQDFFKFIAACVKKDMNIALVTNHGILIDIALVQAALCNSLMKLNDEELRTKMRTGIIVSKIVSMMGVALSLPDQPETPAAEQPEYPAPGVAEILSNLLCNDVFLTFPRTPSIEKALGRFGRSKLRHHNTEVKKLWGQILDKGGVLLAIAPSGTKDKPVKGDPNLYMMAQLTKGTIDILMHGKTLVLPASVLLEGDNIQVEHCGLHAVNSIEVAHGIQQKICDKTNELATPPKQFVYDMPRDTGKR